MSVLFIMVTLTMALLRSEVNNLKRINSNLKHHTADLEATNASLLQQLEVEKERNRYFEMEKAKADYSSGASQGLSQLSTGIILFSLQSSSGVCALF